MFFKTCLNAPKYVCPYVENKYWDVTLRNNPGKQIKRVHKNNIFTKDYLILCFSQYRMLNPAKLIEHADTGNLLVFIY